MKKRLILGSIVFILLVCGLGVLISNYRYNDSLKYGGNEYLYLEYRNDTFYYDLNNSYNFEVEEINRINHKKWDMIHSEGDVFVLKNQVDDAIKYYGDDDNYDWFFVYEKDEDNIKIKEISISKEEIKYLYDIDNIKREKAILFDDIEKFGSIKKISKDKFVSGSLSICLYDGKWYWKSEIMTDDDKEYIVELPKSLTKKFK